MQPSVSTPRRTTVQTAPSWWKHFSAVLKWSNSLTPSAGVVAVADEAAVGAKDQHTCLLVLQHRAHHDTTESSLPPTSYSSIDDALLHVVKLQLPLQAKTLQDPAIETAMCL